MKERILRVFDLIGVGPRLRKIFNPQGEFDFTLGCQIQPTLDFMAIATVRRLAYAALNLTGASFVAVDTVPSGKRWRLLKGFSDSTAGSCAAAVQLLGVASASRIGAPATGTHVETFEGFFLEAGDQLGAIGGSNGADASIGWTFLIMEEPSGY